MKTQRNSRFAGWRALLGVATSVLLLGQSAQAQELTIASFGGKLDVAIKEALQPYVDKTGITLKWVPGAATENAAKVLATKDSPEYDLALMEGISYSSLVGKNVLAPLDAASLPNYGDLAPQAKLADGTGMPLGFFYTGLFYNEPEFKKRGWAAPTSWDDLLRPEFCNYVGLMHPNVVYGLHTLLMMGNGQPDGIEEGIKKMSSLKNCVATLEPSSPKFEEKTQLGEYLIGANGTIRVAPLIDNGYPLSFTIPKEGAVATYTVVVVPSNSPNLDVARGVVNWLIGPEAQQVLMEKSFYAPVNVTVAQSDRLREFGVPTADQTDKIIVVDSAEIAAHRRDWVRALERAFSR